MAIRYLATDIVRTDSSGDVFTFQCMPRSVGVLRYRSDAGDRFEFVPPELMFARNDAGELMIGALGNAPATLEHPIGLIRHDARTRSTFQVGKVKPKVELYRDGTSVVEVEVYDSATIDAIRSGQKRGVSLGYQCGVKQDSGDWNGQQFTHRQQAPIRVDHLAIVANPRNPEALIQRHDSLDSDIRWSYTDSGLAVPESSNTVISMYTPSEPPPKTYDLYLDGELFTNLDADVYVALMQLQEDFAAKYDAACGRGWVGQKGNCKRKGQVKNMSSQDKQAWADKIRASKGMGTRGENNAARKLGEKVKRSAAKVKSNLNAEKKKPAPAQDIDAAKANFEARVERGGDDYARKGSEKDKAKKRRAAAAKGAKTRARGKAETDFLASNPAARKAAQRQMRKRGASQSSRLGKRVSAAERRKKDSFDFDLIPPLLTTY